MASPQIALHGSLVSGTANVQLELSGFTPDIYSYQWVVSNVQGNGTPQLKNMVAGWTPASSAGAGVYSLVGLDLSLAHPLSSQATVVSTLTESGFAQGSSVHLNSVVLTQMKPGAQAQDLDLNALPVNWLIDGPIGVTLPDQATASQYTGGDGVDTLVFAKTRESYNVTVSPASISVTDRATGATDVLTKFDRIQFNGSGVAYDLDAAAGSVAKILGALWGASSVSNAQMVGIGLALFDQGLDAKQIMHLALPARLGAGYQGADVVRVLYENLVHQTPGASEVATWTAQVGVGQNYDSYESLALFAADLPLNTQPIGLTGLHASGIAYIP